MRSEDANTMIDTTDISFAQPAMDSGEDYICALWLKFPFVFENDPVSIREQLKRAKEFVNTSPSFFERLGSIV